ncbi:hypothetical protein KC19_3G255000 [Ceratodon purpureus]|uniref:Secreted protein n=1 Tax=Ceratodon purpureus TaxID=3225 RepID=A0A8T0IQF7_CERPU|nr:hypothetical protein KC19_3G255000 [Ceratodon purpureus]
MIVVLSLLVSSPCACKVVAVDSYEFRYFRSSLRVWIEDYCRVRLIACRGRNTSS